MERKLILKVNGTSSSKISKNKSSSHGFNWLLILYTQFANLNTNQISVFGQFESVHYIYQLSQWLKNGSNMAKLFTHG